MGWELEDVEKPFVAQLHGLGWVHIEGSLDNPAVTGRTNFAEVVQEGMLRQRLRALNPGPDGQPWLDDARLSAPHFQGSLYVNYGFDLSARARANASVVFQYVGNYPGSFPNVPGQPTTTSPTYGFTDAYENVNATFAVAMDRLTIGAYVENVFDNHSITYVHPEAFLASRFATLRPRTVGVRLGYDF